MEKNIIHHLLFCSNELEEQIEAVKYLRMIPESFYDKETKTILKAIEFSHDMNKIADERSVSTYFTFKKSKFDVDDYFWEINESEAKKIVLKQACDLFVKQKEKEINLEMMKNALSEYEKTGNISLISGLSFASVEKNLLVKNIKEATRLTLEKFLLIKEKKETKSIKFTNNFFYTKTILKGLEPGELIILGARPGVGKTAFGLALLNDFSKQKKKSMYITLEMSAEELVERMLTAKTGIPRSVILSETGFTNEKFFELGKAADLINEQTITIVDNCYGNFLEIKEIIKEEQRKKGLDIVFIDYLGLISSFDGSDSFSVRDMISKISRSLKILAKELQIPIILLHQVNRNAAGGTRDDASFKELQLTDLRDSGSLEQDADKVFLLYNQEAKTDEDKQDILDSKFKVILKIAKNRNGQSNQKILFEFNQVFQRVKEIDWLTKPSTWGKSK